MKKILLSVFVISIISGIACKKNVALTPEQEDDVLKKYITEHQLTATKTPSGLYVVYQDSGTGNRPNIQSEVTVNYKGYFTDGKVFDSSSPGKPLQIPLESVILGWQEGIALFAKGGKGILLMPSKLAYGSSGSGDIQPNTPIIFDVELVDFK